MPSLGIITTLLSPGEAAAYDDAVGLTSMRGIGCALIGRRAPDLTEQRLLEALGSASELGEDVKGNRRMSIRLDEMLVVVVDEANQVVVTIWREE